MTRKKPSGGDKTEAERARRIADQYFSFDNDEDESDEAKRRRRHLDEGFEEGAPDKGRLGPGPAGKPAARLTARQAAFVTEYFVDFNGTQAAIRAGYSAATAHQAAYENLRKPEIRRLIAEESKSRAARANWDANAVLLRLAQELTADMAELFDERGRLLPIEQWPLVWRTGLVAGIEVEEITNVDAAGEVIPGVVRKIKLSDRLKRLELMGKHINVLAFRERKGEPEPEHSPLKRLLDQLAGTSIRPGPGADMPRTIDVMPNPQPNPHPLAPEPTAAATPTGHAPETAAAPAPAPVSPSAWAAPSGLPRLPGLRGLRPKGE